MSKVKSAICLTLMTILIAALVIVCFIPIQYGRDAMHRFDPIVVWADRDPDLGTSYGAARDEDSLRTNYIGGGYSAVYYPEGVISAKEYNDNLNGISDPDKRAEYADKYVPYGDGALYLEEEVAYENGALSEDFVASFESAKELLRTRFERLHEETRVDVVDGLTARVTVPRDLTSAFTLFGYTGDFTVRFGSDQDSAETVLPRRPSESIQDYVKGARARTVGGNHTVIIDFTDAGRDVLAAKTATVAEGTSASYLYFMVGDNLALSLQVTTQIDDTRLPITSTSFASSDAQMAAILIDTAVGTVQTDLRMVVGDMTSYPAFYGENAMLYLYIAFGVLFLAMMVFFLIRYKLLAFVNLYTYLLFVCVNLLCIWAIPFLTLSVETVTAFLIASVLLCASNAFAFEEARKEFEHGKTMTSSVKAGYKKCFWHLFDLHIVIALLGFITYFIAFVPLSGFAFTLGLATVFSGVFTLAINRFNWCIMMAYCKNKGAFCNFKRKEVDDD